MAEGLGMQLDEAGLERAMRHMDVDGDGEVTLDEFALWWRGMNAEAADAADTTGATGRPLPFS
jgi:hypothetical protein